MKITLLYSITFFLALFLIPNDILAHRVEPAGKHKHVVRYRPIPPKIVFHSPSVVKSGYMWIDGYYTWNKRTQSYDWVRGRYIKQKRGKIWITGRWVRVRGGWVYETGHWQRPQRI